MSERGPLAALAEIVPRYGHAWLVGGAVRDELLGRDTPDFDLTVQGDVQALARELGRRADGHAFELSDEFGAWRVRSHEQDWQVDLTPLMGETLDQDLRRRDLTINAIARELKPGDATLIDPWGGVADLEAGRLRSVGPEAFSSDPLRVLRLVRMAAELGFTADPDTLRLAAASAPALSAVAVERVFTELRLTLVSERAVEGLELASRVGATAAVLPELDALRGVQQSSYHHLDVYSHTLATLQAAIDLQNDPAATFGEQGPGAARRCWPSRSPTSSRAARRCVWVRCCTTSPSRSPTPSPTKAGRPSSNMTCAGRHSRRRSSRGCAPASA